MKNKREKERSLMKKVLTISLIIVAVIVLFYLVLLFTRG